MWYEYVLGTLFFGSLAALIICILVDTMRCKHEWEEHTFQKGGATKYYLICKKCGKVKVLK